MKENWTRFLLAIVRDIFILDLISATKTAETILVAGQPTGCAVGDVNQFYVILRSGWYLQPGIFYPQKENTMSQIQFFNGWTMDNRPAALVRRLIALDVVTDRLGELVQSFRVEVGSTSELKNITVSLGWLLDDLCELLELDEVQRLQVFAGAGGSINVINNDRILNDANIE